MYVFVQGKSGFEGGDQKNQYGELVIEIWKITSDKIAKEAEDIEY